MLPNLKAITFSGNAVEFNKTLTIQVVDSVFISSVNGQQLTEKDLRAAFALSPLVGYSLRSGRDKITQRRRTHVTLSRVAALPTENRELSNALQTINVQNAPRAGTALCRRLPRVCR
jgi:hypothetical protein